MLAQLKAKVLAFVRSPKVRDQVVRFARLTAAGVVSSGIVADLVHGTATRAAVVAAVVGAVEVAFRTVVPPKIHTAVGTFTVTHIVGDVTEIAEKVAGHLHKTSTDVPVVPTAGANPATGDTAKQG